MRARLDARPARPAPAPARAPTPARALAPDALVLSGGGVRGVAMFGAVDRLRTAGVLRGVRTVVGTSAGSILGALVATRADLRRSLDVLCAHGYAPDFDFSRLFKRFGLDSGKSIDSLVDALLPGSPTFADVRARHGTRLVVVATNLTTRRAEYFGPDTHPDMPVALAVRMSCSIPLFFCAVEHGGALYCDGSVANDLACEWAERHGARRVLGIALKPRAAPVTSLDSFLGAVIETSLAAQREPGRSRARVLDLDVSGVSSFNFSAPKAQLRSLYDAGHEQADAFVKKAE